MGDVMPVQKVTIVGRGDALGLAYYLPVEDRYLHTKEELLDVMKVALAGRAAEQIVFGRVTNGAASDLEKVTQIARAMVFEFGMSEVAPVADDAGGQLRAVRGDEADARQPSRRGSPITPTRRRCACSASIASARPARRRRCSRRRRSTATSSSR